MNELNPVYTQKADCRDCYRCIRECPVKAIKIEDDSACIINSLCIHCGTCVQACPVGAKKIRDDIPKAKQIIDSDRPVILSLAPSWRAEFRGVSVSKMIQALRKLGFSEVSETAVGAQMVSSSCADLIDGSEDAYFLSTACPTVVELINKYHPSYSKYLTPVVSPLAAHVRYLKTIAPDNAAFVFAGPCASKKIESNLYKEPIAAALTFSNLRKWFKDEDINFDDFQEDDSIDFYPLEARDGGLYPIDGGMIPGIKGRLKKTGVEFMSFSGIQNITRALSEIDKLSTSKQVFIELLACEGGCVNGPGMSRRDATIIKRDKVFSSVDQSIDKTPALYKIDTSAKYEIQPVDMGAYPEPIIRSALQSVGKFSLQDELNCGSCGYDSCRDFAVALLDGKATENMCVSYMRKQASKKANALIKVMPAGVVLVDSELRIIECNRNFASIFGPDIELIYDAAPGMEGAMLEKIVPFSKLFRKVLATGEDWVNHDISMDDRQLNISIFTIEKERVAGAVIQDVRVPHVRRDQVVKKVDEVIRMNLETVQKIAYLLGENASETEIRLNHVLEAFKGDTEDKDGTSYKA